jgi:hypothetical protein
VLSATQYLQSASRPTSLIDLGDIVKGGALGIHYAWTKDISSGVSTEAQIQVMIFSYGIRIETKLLNDEIKPKSEGTGLPATDMATKARLLEEQLAALAATGEAVTGGRGRGRGWRGRGRGGAGGRGPDTRMCYGCHKRGHIRRDCPKEATDDVA